MFVLKKKIGLQDVIQYIQLLLFFQNIYSSIRYCPASDIDLISYMEAPLIKLHNMNAFDHRCKYEMVSDSHP